jgi:hypothetical protein
VDDGKAVVAVDYFARPALHRGLDVGTHNGSGACYIIFRILLLPLTHYGRAFDFDFD